MSEYAIVLPDGKTVGEHVVPMVEKAYAENKVTGLLPEGF